MGRKRSEFVCPKCNKFGYLVESPTRNGDYLNARTRRYKYVVHYDSVTKKRMKCYVNNISPGIELNKKNEETSDFSGTTSTDDVYEKPLELDLDNCYKITEIEYRKLSKEEKLKALQHIPHFDKEYHSRIVEKKLMMEKICKESNISIPNLVNSATISPVKYHGISKTHEQIGLLAQDFINLKMACRSFRKCYFIFRHPVKLIGIQRRRLKFSERL